MVKIRLKRLGSKFNAFYKIVVADSRASRDGKFIEALGHYNPHSKEFVINFESLQKWISNGAQPTETVFNLFREHKLNEKLIKPVVKKEKKTSSETTKEVKKTTKKPSARKTKTDK